MAIKAVVIILLTLISGSLVYSASALLQTPSWIVSAFSQALPPSGINGSIAINRGAITCRVPFPDPQGNVLVQSANGKIIRVHVRWSSTACDLKLGDFKILIHPGTYHVSFAGYPLTVPPNSELGLTNLPLMVMVEPHMLAQVRLSISYGI